MPFLGSSAGNAFLILIVGAHQVKFILRNPSAPALAFLFPFYAIKKRLLLAGAIKNEIAS